MSDRLRSAFASLVKAVAPQLLYLGVYEYRVITSHASLLPGVLTWAVDAIPADLALVTVLPSLAGITIWPGPAWGFSKPLPGSLVRVAFVNADPGKPAIVGMDPSGLPTDVEIGAPAPAALPLATGPWAIAAAAALTTFAGAVGSASNIGQVAAAGTALSAALGALPVPATLITKAA